MSSSTVKLSEKHIRELWVRMAEIYGHKWTSAFGTTDKHNTWLTGLSGVTPSLLAVGLRACISRTDSWPPSLPEFRALCLNVPDDDTAIQQAIHGGGGSLGAAIRRRIGSWDISHGTHDQLKVKARSVFHQAMQDIQQDSITMLTSEVKVVG